MTRTTLRERSPAGAGAFEIRPFDTPIGAEVLGLDLRQPVEDAHFAEIEAAFSRWGVLVFPEQVLSERDLVAFTRRFGEIENYALNDYFLEGYPEILLVSNIRENGRNVGLVDAGSTWHTDMSYTAVPPRATALYAIEVPVRDGRALGDTLFASAVAAYDDLDPAAKRLIEDRWTTHSYEGKHARRAAVGKLNRKPLTAEQKAKLPPVEHPVARTHPVTGQKCLYVVAGECSGITGMADAEAAPLLEELAERCTRESYRYRHSWRVGDLVIWDNCLVQHTATQDYDESERRLLWRTTVKGTPTF